MVYDLARLQTPCYLIDLGRLRDNLRILGEVQGRTGCKILLALKAYAAWSTFGLCRKTLAGTSASALHEVRLAREFFGGEVHLCAPAYRDDEIEAVLELVDHLVFNSPSQWLRYRDRVRAAGRPVQCGLRLNPRHSEVRTALYDPCASGSRLGIPPDQFREDLLEGVSGLHFHTLCELGADALQRTLEAVERHFGPYFDRMEWANFGGGHHITRPDYDVDLLCDLITRFARRHRVQVYLEPGEAVALDAGVLVASVLDIVRNDLDVAILDTSAAAHMPDVIEMPYRPVVVGAAEPGAKPHTYRLAGPTCLAGDVIGDYAFDTPLRPGDRLVFTDMAHYTMVKNTMFNGINLPDIVLYEPQTDTYRVQRRFTYEDFKGRLS